MLLGEPGIGKSTAVEDEAERLAAAEQRVFRRDLRNATSSTDMVDLIFNDEPFATADTRPATLFLDGLDEAFVFQQGLEGPLGTQLSRRLAGDAARRLHLRITCRAMQWPGSFTDRLGDIFGKDKVETWHACPLRRADVVAAAQAHGLDGEVFAREIDDCGATALAIKPVTLDLLLQIKLRKGGLPDRQVEVYRQGLPQLCQDPSAWRQERPETGAVGRLAPGQCLALARRIAALSIFCQRPLLQPDAQPGLPEPGVLTLEEICASPLREPVGDETTEFQLAAVREVLGTGLFRSAGGTLVTWAHKTYGEFLAADYLAARNFSGTQIAELIHPPGIHRGRIAPQLTETVAWLTALRPDLGRSLMQANPDVLLRSDVLVGDDDARAALARIVP